jgi:uncharacterized protein (TIGR03083 family)
MTSLVTPTVQELRANHDRLASVVDGLTDDQLSGPSGAEKWTVADVLSHLGSGAEIGWHQVAVAVGETSGDLDNQQVWDRWNALPPAEQASGFLLADDRLVSLLEGLPADAWSSATVDLGFLPAPVPLTTPLAMRLSEQTLHGWDVAVGLDPQATLAETAADLVLRHYAETIPFLLGFAGQADALAEPVRLAVGEHTLVIDGSVSLAAGAAGATATFVGPREAAVRLLAGRLDPEHTPAGTEVTGNASLDDLRRVFQGY